MDKGLQTQPDDGFWEALDEAALKRALNELLWQHARPSVTVREAENAACKAFDALMPLMQPEKPPAEKPQRPTPSQFA